MARLGGSWVPARSNVVRSTIRVYPNYSKISCEDLRDEEAYRRYHGNNIDARNLERFGDTGSMISLERLERVPDGGSSYIDDRDEKKRTRRSPSLPPICNGIAEQRRYSCQERARETHRRHDLSDESKEKSRRFNSPPGEERGGETSGYASDCVDPPLPAATTIGETNERIWRNPYRGTPESSLPPSRRFSEGRSGEQNRPRWGALWGRDATKEDPPAPSWLARLGHTSQVLVINHDSASSPDSSTTGSTGSDPNRNRLRGQSIPIDAEVLLEREAKRQKALELRNAIERQLEEKDKRKKEERERRIREERSEEERIQRELNAEKERLEEEQRKTKEKEEAKQKKAEAMREVLEAAEKLAREEKKNRRKREVDENPNTDNFHTVETARIPEVTRSSNQNETTNQNQSDDRIEDRIQENTSTIKSQRVIEDPIKNQIPNIPTVEEPKNSVKVELEDETVHEENKTDEVKTVEKEIPKERESARRETGSVRVPISREIAIVLGGRLDNTDILGEADLRTVKLVLSSSPRKYEESPNCLNLGLNALTKLETPVLSFNSSLSPRIVENRLLTPSKYRVKQIPSARDFGTQTDVESDLREVRDRIRESSIDDGSMKDRKDAKNADRRDAEKSTNSGPQEEPSNRAVPRSKSQPRTTLESRPRWNANRPGTRYRTQSEKDPHYQRRLRLRRRRAESSDEGSRSPSPDRRKITNTKSKLRNSNRREFRPENYDADLSMDSLNSIVQLRVDKRGRLNIEDTKNGRIDEIRSNDDPINALNRERKIEEDNSNVWCGREILSRLSSLKNGLLMKKLEWEPDECLVSSTASEIF